MPPKTRRVSKSTTPEAQPQPESTAPTVSPTAEVTSILHNLSVDHHPRSQQSSRRGSYASIEADDYIEDFFMPRSPTAQPQNTEPARRGGFFSSISGHQRAPLFKPNKLIQDNMRNNPRYFQDAGVQFHKDMTPDELRQELEKCHDHARVLEKQKRDRDRIEKQISDVKDRIVAYLSEIPSNVIPQHFAVGIIANLQRRQGETPIQHLTRIKVVEMPIKKLTNKQTSQEFNDYTQFNETVNLVEGFMNK